MNTDPQEIDYESDSTARMVLRWVSRLALLVAIAYGAIQLLDWIDATTHDAGNGAKMAVSLTLLLAYALLISIPFVPGIELAITYVLMRGPEVAFAVYLATLAGLMIAYLVGRFMPETWLQRICRDLGLRKTEALLKRISPLSQPERIVLLKERLPARIAWLATDFRYVLLALLINLPGSSLIGGGGGILMIAGVTRLFNGWIAMITLAIAIAPVPMAVWFFGIDILGQFVTR